MAGACACKSLVTYVEKSTITKETIQILKNTMERKIIGVLVKNSMPLTPSHAARALH